jgi:MFS family permease
MLASAFTAAAYFAYLAGASFVLQDVYALSPAAYSLVFGLNAAGFALFGFLAGRAAERWSERLAFILGLGIIAVGAGGPPRNGAPSSAAALRDHLVLRRCARCRGGLATGDIARPGRLPPVRRHRLVRARRHPIRGGTLAAPLVAWPDR